MSVDLWEAKGNKHIDMSRKPVNEPYHIVIANLAIKYLPEYGKMLDIGCGLGQIDRLVKNKRPSVRINIADAYQVCLDSFKSEIEIENSFLLSEKDFELCNVGNDYDLIVMSHVLEHVINPFEAIKSILEVIKPGGHLILAVPNPVRPQIIFSNLLKKHYVNRGHIYAWDRSHWINFLENILGLDVVEYASDSINIFPSYLKKVFPYITNKLEIYLANFLPWYSFSNIAVIHKKSKIK